MKIITIEEEVTSPQKTGAFESREFGHELLNFKREENR